MKNFEFDGEQYKAASKHQKEWGNNLISELALRGNEIILDLGCGDGVLTQRLSELVPGGKVIGIDASSGMINTAEKLAGDNLSFICMDINDINFENQFDVIFSNATLHWVFNHDKLLKNSFAALKIGGIIQWNFAGDGTCSNFYETVETLMKRDDYKQYFEEFALPWFMPSKSEYEKLLCGCGFSSVKLNYINADRYFADAEEMIKWINQPSIVPFIEQIPDEKKEIFRQNVIDMMISKTKQPDGRCFETFRRINLMAIK